MKPSPRSPWNVFLRLLAASIGGYAWASLAAMAIAFIAPWCLGWSRAEGLLAGSLLSFVFYLGAVIWVFSARSVVTVVACALAAVLGLLLLA